jgi:type II secretory pathway component PulK
MVSKVSDQRNAHRRRGAVLILVLIIFSILSLLAFGLCHRVRLELKMARLRGNRMQAYYLAMGGVNRCVAAIQQDENLDIDHSGEPWHRNTTALAEGFFGARTDRWKAAHRLTYAVTDEQSRLNINLTSPDGWISLPGMNDSLIYSILDWQDEDDSPGPEGAESSFYLHRQPKYRAKNGPVLMVQELGLIRGMDSHLFFGEDINGNSVLDEPIEDDGSQNPPFDDADGVLDLGLMDYFTAFGDGKININTVGQNVLLALPGIEQQFAREIVAHRIGTDGVPFTEDDQPFTSMEELELMPGATSLQLELLEQYGNLKTSYFRITSEAVARVGGQPVRLTGIVKREDKKVELILLNLN